MPPSRHIAQIRRNLASVERVRRNSSLVIVLLVTVLLPIVVIFIFLQLGDKHLLLILLIGPPKMKETLIPHVDYTLHSPAKCHGRLSTPITEPDIV